jgi:preprotein translocase subunit SecY
MWLGEQITSRGIGNGTSLIIFAGIVAGLPGALAQTFELGRTGALSAWVIVLFMVLAMAMVILIVYMERSYRRIVVQYPKRQQGMRMYGGESSHIPLKLNSSGVIPPIFASSILLFPATIAGFQASKDGAAEWLQTLVRHVSHGSWLYIVLYVALIVFFCFFYTAVVFNPQETAENLKKNGGFVPGRRPGKNTAEYFDYVLTRLTVAGAAYIALVCVLPEILIAEYSVPFYLGGTSLLITVNVVIDTLAQVQTHLFAHQYEGLIRKAKLKGKRR